MWEGYLVGSFYKEKIGGRWVIKYDPQDVDFRTHGDKSYPVGLYDYIKDNGKTEPVKIAPSEERILKWLEARSGNNDKDVWKVARASKLTSHNDKYWLTTSLHDLSAKGI